MTQTVLIAGASGKIGHHAAIAFAAAGWQVRLYDRTAGNLTAQAMGADVIVNGMNPQGYHDWKNQLPRITSEVIAAAQASGATVVLPGNVYNYGREPAPWSEQTPQRPVSRKGELRRQLEDSYRASGVQTIVLRAGNFIDPTRNGCVMTLVYLPSIARDKITVPGDPDALQAYAYLPDWARAAVALCERRADLATYEDVPFPGHAFSARELAEGLSRALGRPIGMKRFPWTMMRVASPVWELARELLDMRYLWSVPHTLSGEKLARLVPDFEPTPLAQVMVAALPPEVYPDQRMPAAAHLA